MKNLMILAIASLVIASCSSPRVERKPSDIKISWQVDTTVTCQEPITAPRFSCNGKVLPNPKLLGMKQVQSFLSFRKDTVISGDSLLKWGYLPAGEVSSSTKKGSDFSWLWDILKWIFAIVGLIVALALALLLLGRLFSVISTERSSISRSSHSSESSGGGHRRDNQHQSHSSGAGQNNDGGNDHPINIENVEHFHVYINTRGRNRG